MAASWVSLDNMQYIRKNAAGFQGGWKYGEERDDVNKLTPCLVKYEELPKSEKEYDQNTSLETIKLIIKLGYKILPPIG